MSAFNTAIDLALSERERRIITDTLCERARQLAKWGVQDHEPVKWLAILTEEVGEVAKAVLEENSVVALRAELVQVAAVAQAFIECLDRNGGWSE